MGPRVDLAPEHDAETHTQAPVHAKRLLVVPILREQKKKVPKLLVVAKSKLAPGTTIRVILNETRHRKPRGHHLPEIEGRRKPERHRIADQRLFRIDEPTRPDPNAEQPTRRSAKPCLGLIDNLQHRLADIVRLQTRPSPRLGQHRPRKIDGDSQPGLHLHLDPDDQPVTARNAQMNRPPPPAHRGTALIHLLDQTEADEPIDLIGDRRLIEGKTFGDVDATDPRMLPNRPYNARRRPRPHIPRSSHPAPRLPDYSASNPSPKAPGWPPTLG